jgi:hypothetical protein
MECPECVEKNYGDNIPRIVIFIRGGLVQDVYLESEAKVLVLDYDIDGTGGNAIVDGEEVHASLYDGVNRCEAVDTIFREAGWGD